MVIGLTFLSSPAPSWSWSSYTGIVRLPAAKCLSNLLSASDTPLSAFRSITTLSPASPLNTAHWPWGRKHADGPTPDARSHFMTWSLQQTLVHGIRLPDPASSCSVGIMDLSFSLLFVCRGGRDPAECCGRDKAMASAIRAPLKLRGFCSGKGAASGGTGGHWAAPRSSFGVFGGARGVWRGNGREESQGQEMRF